MKRRTKFSLAGIQGQRPTLGGCLGALPGGGSGAVRCSNGLETRPGPSGSRPRSLRRRDLCHTYGGTLSRLLSTFPREKTMKAAAVGGVPRPSYRGEIAAKPPVIDRSKCRYEPVKPVVSKPNTHSNTYTVCVTLHHTQASAGSLLSLHPHIGGKSTDTLSCHPRLNANNTPETKRWVACGIWETVSALPRKSDVDLTPVAFAT